MSFKPHHIRRLLMIKKQDIQSEISLKIKSIKNLLITINQSQDIKDLKEVRKYIMSHLPKYFKFKDKNE